MVGRLHWLASLIRRRRGFEQELVDELAFHIDARTDTLIASGMTRDGARRQARLELGSVQSFREQSREAGGLRWLEDVQMDARHSLRGFRRTPGFALAVVGILAMGIGATTAVFTVADIVLFRPPPFVHGDRLVQIVGLDRAQGGGGNNLNAHRVHGWQQQDLFERVEGLAPRQFDMRGAGEPERVQGFIVTTGYFTLLGTPPALGRTFLPTDGRKDSEPVVVLSDEIWRRQFSGRPEALGGMLTLNDEPYRVIGVMPASFRPMRAQSLWIPFDVVSRDGDASVTSFLLHARLKPGASVTTTQQRADVLATSMNAADPQPRSWFIGIATWKIVFVSTSARVVLLLLLGTGGFVLLIACANVTSLLLARAAVHERESVVRAALGASRGRLIRLALTDAALLACAGGIAGIASAWLGVRVIVGLVPDEPSFLAFSNVDVAIDWRILGFAALLTLTTTLLIGLLPSVRRSGVRLAMNGMASGSVRQNRRLPGALVIAEISLSMVLLVGAALLMKAFLALTSVDPGFEPKGLVALNISVPTDRYPTGLTRSEFFETLTERVRTLPRVRNAATGMSLPPSLNAFSTDPIEIDGGPALPNGKERYVANLSVSPEYFETLGIQLLDGVLFAPGQETDSIIVNAALAQHLTPGRSVVGHQIRPWPTAPWRTVVGVVNDIELRILGTERIDWQLYIPLATPPTAAAVALPPPRTATRTFSSRWLVVRADAPMMFVPAIRQQITALDPSVRVDEIKDMEQFWTEVRAPQRFALVLVASLAAIAVTLATVGLFALIARDVTQRANEIGVRMALGARPSQILRLVLGSTTLMTIVGIAIGLLGAAALTRYLQVLLFGVTPLDPRMFALAGVVFTLIAGVASYLPSRRAIRLNPQSALRWE